MRKRILLVYLVVLLVIATAVLRSHYISDVLKGAILPEIEKATGTNMTTARMYINILPLYVEGENLVAADREGRRILSIKSAKAYIDLSGFLAGRADIRRLVVKSPQIKTDTLQVRQIVNRIRDYASVKKTGALKVDVLALEIQNGGGELTDKQSGATAEARGLDGEILLGRTRRIRASVKKVGVRTGGWPEIWGSANVILSLNGDKIHIRRLVFDTLGSTVRSSGEYGGKTGRLHTNASILLSSVKKIFGLKRDGFGRIKAGGTVSFGGGDIIVDLNVGGKFYIQTLMELLKVKERIEGLVDISGRIEGPLRHVTAAGRMTLREGNLFNVAVDSMSSRVSYAGGVMKFTDGYGRLYNGRAKVEAVIHLPVVNYYRVASEFSGIGSRQVFRLIGWDPGVQPGKVDGTLKTEGSKFDPHGQFKYRSTGDGKDILGRISTITGRYGMKDEVLSLEDVKLGTGLSSISVRGRVDIRNRTLSLDGRLATSDVTDISRPYYHGVRGSGAFAGKIGGTFDDPVIEGHASILKPVVKGYEADALDADFVYSKKLLEIEGLKVRGAAGALDLKGSVSFAHARELFDLSRPEYDLTSVMRNARMGQFVKIFYPGFRGTGSLSADMNIKGGGDNPSLWGVGSVEDAMIYGVAADIVSFGWRYSGGQLSFANMKVRRGASVLAMDGRIDSTGNFSFRASSDKVFLHDLIGKRMKGDVVFDLKTEGHGTFHDPVISLEARVAGGSLGDTPVGRGEISANIKDGDISLKAAILGGKVQVTARGRLEEELPWEASVEVLPGRYDLLLKAFLKNVPEDLLLDLGGSASLHGDRSHVSASAAVRQMNLSIYGRSFTSEKEILLRLDDRDLQMKDISLRSSDSLVSIEGDVVLGRQYNVILEGKTDLAPFKSLSAKIGLLKGRAEFVLSVAGDWETPQINGGFNIKEGSFALKNYPYRFSSLEGYLYMDNDRLVLQKLAGKFGGGDIALSGVMYMKRFSVKRFYVEAGLNNTTISFSKDFTVSFGGKLLLNGTPASRIISGDIKINRARYKERVEWKSWLLKARTPQSYKAEISDIGKTELNIRITGRDSIRIDNNVARADVSADVVLRGTIYHPVLLGRIESTDGTVYFRNNEFRITHGSADFSGAERLNPFLSIAAETEVKGYKIKLNLEGRLDRFNVSLSSEDPSLRDTDIVALLAVGQTGGELKGLEGGIGASEATSFVTGKLQDVFEERIKMLTGLDRFQIDPYVSKITGTIEPRVTVSKRLLGDRIFVTYASPVGSSEEQIVKLEYFLSRKISLIGVRDERGIVGGDIRFRFGFK